uniref:Uncharacterized protein n=1 Tax=Anopheles merus TaxID=30066 RepID=A0A182UZV2_ANOME
MNAHNFISYHNWADGTVAAAFADRTVPFLLAAPFEVRLGKGLEFWSPAAGAGRCCCPVGSFRQCCDESLPSWVATRLSGRLHESRSFSGPLSSPPSPTSSSPLPFGSKFCVARSVRNDVISFKRKHLLLRVLLSPFGRRRRVWIVSRRIVCGRLTPCSLKYSPQALHTISPRMFRRQMVVVVVPQFVQDMSFCCEFCCCCCCCCCGDCCWDGAVDLVVSSSCGLLLPDALLFVSDRAAAPPWGGVLAEDECSATRNSTFPVVALLPVASLIVAPPPTTPTLMPLLSSDAVGELPSTGVRLGQDCFRRPLWAV